MRWSLLCLNTRRSLHLIARMYLTALDVFTIASKTSGNSTHKKWVEAPEKKAETTKAQYWSPACLNWSLVLNNLLSWEMFVFNNKYCSSFRASSSRFSHHFSRSWSARRNVIKQDQQEDWLFAFNWTGENKPNIRWVMLDAQTVN